MLERSGGGDGLLHVVTRGRCCQPGGRMRVRLTKDRTGPEREQVLSAEPPADRSEYGWVIVATLAVTVTVSYGVLMYAFPVVLTAMRSELGWSQQSLTGAYSIGSLVAGLAAVPVGRRLDRHGPRGVMTVSAFTASALVYAWSQVDTQLGFYAIWIGLGFCMAGLFYEPAFATIVQWFQRGRGRAITIVTIAGGLASTLFVPLTAAMTERLGWRGGLVALSAIMAVTTIIPHAVLLRRAPAGIGVVPPSVGPASVDRYRTPPPIRAVLRSASFRWIVAAFFLSTAANVAFAVHLIPLLLQRGHSLAFASLALGSMGLVKLLGRALVLPLGRRISTEPALILVLLFQGAGLCVLIAGSGAAAVWICVALFGIGDGASTPARAEILAERYGSGSYGAISGVLATFLAGPRALGPVGFSVVHAGTGGYQAPLWIVVWLVVGSAAAVRSAIRSDVRRPPRRPDLRLFRTASVYMGETTQVHTEEEHDMIGSEKTRTEDILEQTRRILSQTPEPRESPTSSSCCSTADQDVCCEPSEKSSCCGEEATSGGGCGCR